MRFDKDTFLTVEVAGLSDKAREEVVRRWFPPERLPPWQEQLRELRQQMYDAPLWKVFTGQVELDGSGDPYPIDHTRLIRRALLRKPVAPGIRVTDFSKWLLFLYWQPSSPQNAAYGKQIESDVAKLARPPKHPDWDLIYRDPLKKNDKPKAFQISALTINGKPLYGTPDLVLRHKISREIVVIERKGSDARIPSDGWPNLKAQLWAYAHIDEFREAPTIHLIGEVWAWSDDRPARPHVYRWVHGNKQFDSSNLQLFELYGGLRRSA